MRREIEITSHILEGGEEAVIMSIGADGVSIESNGGRVCLTDEQWGDIQDEWKRYQRLAGMIAVPSGHLMAHAAEGGKTK